MVRGGRAKRNKISRGKIMKRVKRTKRTQRTKRNKRTKRTKKMTRINRKSKRTRNIRKTRRMRGGANKSVRAGKGVKIDETTKAAMVIEDVDVVESLREKLRILQVFVDSNPQGSVAVESVQRAIDKIRPVLFKKEQEAAGRQAAAAAGAAAAGAAGDERGSGSSRDSMSSIPSFGSLPSVGSDGPMDARDSLSPDLSHVSSAGSAVSAGSGGSGGSAMELDDAALDELPPL